MSWIDDIINGLWDFVFSDTLDALQGIYNFLLNIPATFAEMFGALMMLIVYPIIAACDVLYYILNEVYSSMAGILNSFIVLTNAMIALTELFHSYALPTPWVMLWGMMLTATGYLMIYKKLRGLTILGFKIP